MGDEIGSNALILEIYCEQRYVLVNLIIILSII
jgi:hypothetical protein